MQALADWETGIQRFTVGEYFESGVFFGKATIEAAIVFFLLLFALEASDSGSQQLSAFFFANATPAHDDFTQFI